MKSMICQLTWKLRTTMCFCHSIFIFKIILIFKIIFVFKIMILICFQIWFLIKFKLQRREWVWLKLGFSQANGLLHYKYWSQCMQKEGRLERKTLKEKTPEEAITRNPKREKHKKKGTTNPILPAAPLNPPFFSPVSLDFASSSRMPR